MKDTDVISVESVKILLEDVLHRLAFDNDFIGRKGDNLRRRVAELNDALADIVGGPRYLQNYEKMDWPEEISE